MYGKLDCTFVLSLFSNDIANNVFIFNIYNYKQSNGYINLKMRALTITKLII